MKMTQAADWAGLPNHMIVNHGAIYAR